MINPLLFFSFLLGAAVLFALAEIQIEGEHGWASKLPTWRFTVKSMFKFFEREITGYHTFIFTLIFLLPHFLFLVIPWSLKYELYIISFYVLLTAIEDFLWFVLNPNYGIRKFSKANIVWHKIWFLGLPFDYWITVPIGINLYMIASIL